MTRSLCALALAATTLGCGVAHAPEGAASSEPSRQGRFCTSSEQEALSYPRCP